MGRKLCTAVCVLIVAALAQFVPMVLRLLRIPLLEVSPEEKNSDALRVGIMGTGNIANFAIAYPAGKRRDVLLVAVASRRPETAASFAQRHAIPNVVSGPQAYFELVMRQDLDAIYICLPTWLHFEWASAALAAGKHVLIEKPIASNGKEAAKLQEQAARAGKVLMEAAHYQHHPALKRARDVMRAEIGRLWTIESSFSMIDPRAWLVSHAAHGTHLPFGQGWRAWFAYFFSGEKSLKDALDEKDSHRDERRTKNLDRWWYCADAVLWATQATRWEVAEATELNFGISARVRLFVPAFRREPGELPGKDQQVFARVDMSRDRLMSPFSWKFSAYGSENNVHFDNLGFPFAYHSLDVAEKLHNRTYAETGVRRREYVYGDGETTWEHQLEAFVAAVRGDAMPGLDRSVETMRLVDAIFRKAGSMPLTSERGNTSTKGKWG